MSDVEISNNIKIDFYIANRLSFFVLACKVIETIYERKHQTYVFTESTQQTGQLDEVLWTFKPNNFIPHERYLPEHEQEVAVLIGNQQPPQSREDVLVNLTDVVPVFFNRFSRVVEIVAPDEGKKKIARARFKYYRENGYDLNTHDL